MCTVNVEFSCVVPVGTVTGPQLSVVPAGLIEQVLFHPAPCASIDQETPAFCGSGSFRAVPYASPAPAFQTVTVKPMSSPALTLAASAFFRILMSAAFTQTLSLLLPEPSVVVVTKPVLS